MTDASDLLLLGTRRYSSWSLRAWLAVRLAGLEVREEVIPLKGGGQTVEIHQRSPNRCVPYLRYHGVEIWESLAICQFCAGFNAQLWPQSPEAYGRALSLAAQMHAGFGPLRRAWPMNCGRIFPRIDILDLDVARDLADIEALLTATRARFGKGGAYLFGAAFGIADAVFAPVMSRFATYQVPVSTALADYRDAVLAHPLMRDWYALVMDEPSSWQLDQFEFRN
ncbi:glutathione S-transferase [Candidatus Kirkpatrickella diaphorinae]|uniref:Glutathione S-transferase n=1 Tax=Candidatus Kirkpatrickella diaphorinae TaxID=2984322 RepID=A0ABY6GH77_9PROT|nr:glutathione S-transferase [Candidatus Kirkpatrickella diaphorinae]UYH50649.1 glutathione S-transferase [Candidatus Kirkpatrickella diaphorinae]